MEEGPITTVPAGWKIRCVEELGKELPHVKPLDVGGDRDQTKSGEMSSDSNIARASFGYVDSV